MGDSKQVKVDNWGIFFLQRLQTFFNKTYFCDLTLQFEENVQLKVHRLVLNACTEYFQVLEQTCDSVNDCLIMPPDLQADVVVPIVNFMYSGILEFQTSTFDRLYATARLMNMTVLTKLLDAQKVPISPIPKPLNKRPVAPITWNLQGKKIAPKTMDPDLPEPLPGRKLPIWKRKSAPVTPHITTPIEFSRGLLQTVSDPLANKYFRPQPDEPPRPTRFDWPEDDAFDTAPFDEISYTSKPLIGPTTREKSPKPSTSNFDEVKRSSVKRAASPVYSDNKKVNIQDVKEYIKEQKIRSDYNDYDDSETADNDLQTYDDNDTDDEAQNSEETRGILKNDTSPPHNKRVRFSIEGKENTKTTGQSKEPPEATIKTTGDVTNHTKIITEVLKKFPQLVQKNKNIRLKILAKGQNANSVTAGTPVKVVKPVSKVSYMVHKPTDNKSSNDKKDQQWTCQKCNEGSPVHFDTYHAYRLHLTETHNEKTDSQMCNICGHVSRKQNMLMYHKYVKHNIEPPPIFQFPKCEECPYVALSPSLLIKHQYNHTHQNLVCAECHTAFSNKTDLIRHIQTTGHSGSNNPITTYDCTQCPKKFISSETLNQHIRNNHKEKPKENIITAEEIDAMVEQQSSLSEEPEHIIPDTTPEAKPKEKKIKILSDIKVNKPITTSRLMPVKQQTEEKVEETQQLEQPSSEAESLSNVASGIAASLGLVNTIVVLDENNQFILQDGSQAPGSQQNFILPDNIQNIVSQHQVITTTDSNSIITQAGLAKNSIGSTDELVMVLTDHDYSDATNNAVLTSDNSNIVVLYSHPVQGQDGQFISQPGNLMLNSNMGLVEVSNNFGVATSGGSSSEVAIDKTCDESIEMIQQEINSHLEEEIQNKAGVNQQENVVTVIEDHPGSPEKMEIDPLTDLDVPACQAPLPGIQTIATTQKYMFIPTTTHDNIHEIQENIPVMQENIPEMQDNIPEMQDNIPEMQQHMPEVQQNLDIQPVMQENLPEIQENMQSTIQEEDIPKIEDTDKATNIELKINPTTTTTTTSKDIPFDEPMEVEESVEMVQQEINRQQLERDQLIAENPPEVIPENDQLSSDNNDNNTDIPPIIINSTATTTTSTTISTTTSKEECFEVPQKETVKLPEGTEAAPNQIEESIENIEKELKQKQDDYVEQMEVDSTKLIKEQPPTITSQIIDNTSELGTEEITSPENFDSIENTDQEDAEPNESENIERTNESENIEELNESENIEELNESRNIEEPNECIYIEEPNESENMEEQNESENNEEKQETSELSELREEPENTSEITESQTTQSTDVVDSGIDMNQTESETCAEVSQISETESITQTVDEVSDLPQDTNSSEIIEQETDEIIADDNKQTDNIQKINTERSKKPFRISFTEHSDDMEEEETAAEKDSQNEESEVQTKEITETQTETNEKKENNVEVTKQTSSKKICTGSNKLEINSTTKSKISNLLDDWDDGDTDSQQSDTNKQNVAKKDSNSINTLINDWEDEED